MQKLAQVYLILGSALLFTTAEPKIVFLQNINGNEVIVSSFVATINGTSFSLVCKMIATEVDAKSRKLFDNRVIWSRKRRKSKFSNTNDLLLMENNVPDASLSFTSVMLKDQGVYFCTSLKYKLIKVLNLIVRSEFPLGAVKEETFNLRYSTEKREHSNNSVRRAVRDVTLVDSSRYKYTGVFTPFTYTYPPIHGNYSRKNDHDVESTFRNESPNWFYKDRDHDNSDNLNGHSSLLKFFYLMIGGVFLFIIIYVAVRCCHEDDNDTTPDSSNCQPRNRSIESRNMCSHLVCIQNRSMHPFADCIITTNNSRLLVTCSSNENLRASNLDLPPTYDDSTANLAQNSKHSLTYIAKILNSYNDTCALPPSYEEALSNAPNTNASNNVGGCSAGNASETANCGSGSVD